jgi:hypothetical protein
LTVRKPDLGIWQEIVNFTKDDWIFSRLPFGKFKGRLYQEAREDGELRSWLEWLAESTNERSSAMGRWNLGQLGNTFMPEQVRLRALCLAGVTTRCEGFFPTGGGDATSTQGAVLNSHPETGMSWRFAQCSARSADFSPPPENH